MSYNYSAIVLGPPGCGKTTLVATLVRRHLEQPTGIVFVHDPVQQFARHGCKVYRDANEWRAAAAAAAAGQQQLPRGAAIGGSAEEVTRLALELGERTNSASDTRVPILLAYDEGSLLQTSGSSFMSSLDTELLATRRHRGIGTIHNIQRPTMLMQGFWSFCTDAFIFKCTVAHSKKLDDLLALEPGELARAGCARLERYRYIHVRQGDGIVDEAA